MFCQAAGGYEKLQFFVFEITPDFDDFQFCIRAIDFDQQSYEGVEKLLSSHNFLKKTGFL